MKNSIDCEEERRESRIKYFYFPVADESRPMSEMLHIAHDPEQMERIGRIIREQLSQTETERSSGTKENVEKLKCMMRDAQKRSEAQRAIPVELRTAYDACGRLKKNENQ